MSARTRLSRELIIRTAADLLDRADGREVTLAQVADALGVRTPSLYNHIDGQDDLHRGVAVFAVRELGARIAHAAIGKTGDAAVLAIGHAYRQFARERPGLYRASLRAPGPDQQDLIAASGAILAVLRLVLDVYGLAEADQVHAIRGLRSLLHGFVSLELAGGFGLPVDLDQSFHRLLQTFLDGLRRERARADGAA